MEILSIEETKKRLIDFLFSLPEYHRQVNSVEYQTRCPYCGDSTKNYNTGHFYISIDVDDRSVIPCICFKCDHRGIVTDETLKLMNCTDEALLQGLVRLNKHGKYTKKTAAESAYLYFDRNFPENLNRYPKKLAYINERFGIDFVEEELYELKVIPSLYEFLITNNIKESPFNKDIRTMLERDYVGFLSVGNSHILFRDITDSHKYKWIKYPIDSESRKNKVFYGLASQVDIFTEEEIEINLSEGVFDAIGIASFIKPKRMNQFHLAVCGQNFNSNILHLVDSGVFGSNVTLNIFADNDPAFNQNSKRRGSIEELHRRYLNKFRGLFKGINLYYNLKEKDYGVKKEQLDLERIQI